jgi:hypothetical protein
MFKLGIKYCHFYETTVSTYDYKIARFVEKCTEIGTFLWLSINNYMLIMTLSLSIQQDWYQIQGNFMELIFAFIPI